MAIEINTPSFHGNDHERLQQVERYLFQLAQQLQFALRDTDSEKDTYNTEIVTKKSLEETLEKYVLYREYNKNNSKVADEIQSIKDNIIPV